MSRVQGSLRPLIARPGARFSCFGDGLCCTDIHGLGLLTRSEVRELRVRNKLAVIHSDELGGECLQTVDHKCLFLENDRCAIHARDGAAAKPAGCRRFPYGLVRTPQGGRITTEHRCPCRTLGERPEIVIENADMSLRDRAGRLDVDRDIPERIALAHKQRVAFSVYAALEAKLIARLNAGERAEQVLAATPLPRTCDVSWVSVAAEHIETRDNTAGGEAFAWFGDALLQLAAGHIPPRRARPWHASFARALARCQTPPDPERIYNDWIADEIWMFRWLPWGPFDVARSELTTRLLTARRLQALIEAQDVSPGQAAAEAVMICELVAEGHEWPRAVSTIVMNPSPAQPLEP